MRYPFPECKVGLDGSFSVVSAPDRASFPLAWLISPDRAVGKIKTEKDIVSFLPTDGETVRYRIVSFDTQSHRFVGERI